MTVGGVQSWMCIGMTASFLPATKILNVPLESDAPFTPYGDGKAKICPRSSRGTMARLQARRDRIPRRAVNARWFQSGFAWMGEKSFHFRNHLSLVHSSGHIISPVENCASNVWHWRCLCFAFACCQSSSLADSVARRSPSFASKRSFRTRSSSTWPRLGGRVFRTALSHVPLQTIKQKGRPFSAAPLFSISEVSLLCRLSGNDRIGRRRSAEPSAGCCLRRPGTCRLRYPKTADCPSR